MLIRIKHARQSDYRDRVNEHKKLSGGQVPDKEGRKRKSGK